VNIVGALGRVISDHVMLWNGPPARPRRWFTGKTAHPPARRSVARHPRFRRSRRMPPSFMVLAGPGVGWVNAAYVELL